MMYLRIGLPYTGTTRGFRVSPATLTTDTVLAVPQGAIGLILWFERSGAKKTDPITIVGGKVCFANSDTKITNFDTGFGEQPPEAVHWPVALRRQPGPTHVHRYTGIRGSGGWHLALRRLGSALSGNYVWS